MKKNNGDWKIYDVNIEGVSLVQNYRSQFQSILLNQTAAQLIEPTEGQTERAGIEIEFFPRHQRLFKIDETSYEKNNLDSYYRLFCGMDFKSIPVW